MAGKTKNREHGNGVRTRAAVPTDPYMHECDLDENEETFAHILKRIVHAKIARRDASLR